MGSLPPYTSSALSHKQVEKLGVDHADEEVEGGIRVRHDEEQRRFLIAQRVQLQFIVHGEVTQFLDVEGASLAPQEMRMDFAVLPAASL